MEKKNAAGRFDSLALILNNDPNLIRLVVIATLGPYLVPFLLKPLRARFPQLKLLLAEGQTRALIRQLEEGELD